MPKSLKTGHVGLIILFFILICTFVAILLLSAPNSSFNKVASKKRVKSTTSTNAGSINDSSK